MSDSDIDSRPIVQELFNRIKAQLPELKQLLDEESQREDEFYRYYHTSFKVYLIQHRTQRIVSVLRKLLPGKELNADFLELIKEGTGQQWTREHNEEWRKHTRPLLEAFFHARHFLAMVVKYGEELEYPPNFMPTGWATVLYLYNLR